MQSAIYGLAGEILAPDERDFFRDADPAGYILFKRNCADRTQLRALTDTLRALHGRDDLAILIDQEGGRVARMQPPEWPEFPRAERFDDLYKIAPISAIEAARANAQAIAVVLREVGVTVDCLPLLDVRQPGANDIIGDRALGCDPMQVFLYVTLPLIIPAIAAGWMLAFTLSLDDVVIASFTTGPGSATLPIRIYSEVRLGVKPEINAICTMVIALIAVVIVIASFASKLSSSQGESAASLRSSQ